MRGVYFKSISRRFAARCYFMLALAIFFPQAADAAFAAEIDAQQADIEVFVREGCPHCASAEKFLATLQLQKPELRIVIRDVQKDPAALQRLKSIAEKHAGVSARVPAFAVGGQLIVGYSEEANTEQLILHSLESSRQTSPDPGKFAENCAADESLSCGQDASASALRQQTYVFEFLGRRVSPEQLGLPLFSLAIGLLDGFNPCSMWVLILMISLLAPMHDRPRMLLMLSVFIAVQGIAYFVFMAAWLNLFFLIGLSRISEILIAVLALLAGAINLKDFMRLGRGITLSIPAAAKPGIYARIRSILVARSLIAAVSGVIVLAILVQIVELMCTSGLPALFTRILTMHGLDKPSYYGYLALYDLAYMLDDLIMLSVGVITLSQRRLQEREGRWLKLLSALVMVGLGVYLLV